MGRFQSAPVVGSARGGEVHSLTGKEFFDGIRETSLGLTALGMEAGERVAIMSESRPEWLTVDLAIIAGGAIPVPIYPTLSAAQVRYILEDSGATIAVGLDPASAREDPGDPASAARAAGGGRDRRGRGRTDAFGHRAGRRRGSAATPGCSRSGARRGNSRKRFAPSGPSSSRRSSTPRARPASRKGVMLTHAALVSNLSPPRVSSTSRRTDVGLSFLPLSHAFERMAAWVYLLCGVHIVFAESFDTVGRDIALVRPTVLTGVPRVYEKLQARILSKGAAAPPRRRRRSSSGRSRAGERRARAVLRGRQPGVLDRWQARLADRLVFGKVREASGRPGSLSGVRQRAAGDRRGRVLLCASGCRSSKATA